MRFKWKREYDGRVVVSTFLFLAIVLWVSYWFFIVRGSFELFWFRRRG